MSDLYVAVERDGAGGKGYALCLATVVDVDDIPYWLCDVLAEGVEDAADALRGGGAWASEHGFELRHGWSAHDQFTAVALLTPTTTPQVPR